MKTKTEKWKMPDWMPKILVEMGYRVDEVYEAMHCNGRNCDVFVNAPRALLCIQRSTVAKTLLNLKQQGLLR